MSPASTGLARSIHVRLVRHAREAQLDPNFILSRFAIERFLHRLGCSPYADRFVLKGALLLHVWIGETIRPTRDADLLGFGDFSADSLARILAEVCNVEVPPDGMEFFGEHIQVELIRKENEYGGRRAVVPACLGSARLQVQVDVGIGDAVVPEPRWIEYPSLLDLPRPRLKAYEPETAIAEKLHAMVELGERNSRMRDFFDVDRLAMHRAFESQRLVEAVRATFERRGRQLPVEAPLALTHSFSRSTDKAVQWSAFLKRLGPRGGGDDLDTTVSRIRHFLMPVLAVAHSPSPSPKFWRPGGPWRDLEP